MSTTSIRWQRIRATWSAGVVLAATVVLPIVVAPSAAAAVSPLRNADNGLVSADALPTVQIDGVVWQQAIVGDTVYAGGKFSTARPAGSAPGSNQVTRSNLLAYNIKTGALISSFAPSLNGQVRAVTVSPDGTRLYVGGEFTTLNGASRQRIAAFNTATGALVATFAARVDYTVQAIVATNTTVYVGGKFTHSGSAIRTRLAAFRATDGALLAWNPSADGTVNAMVMAPAGDKLIIGGAFQNVNGTASYGLAAIDANTGVKSTWNAVNSVRDAGANAAILALTADSTSIYGVGYVYGAGGNLEGTFKADAVTGNIQWIEDCHGDTYDVDAVEGYIYTVSHAHFCGNVGGFPESNPRSTNMRHALAFTTAATGTVLHNSHSPGSYKDWFGFASPSMYNWFPDVAVGTYTGQSQSAWDVTGNADYVVMGGEFPKVNGTSQQGLVRFARRPLSPTSQGPRLAAASFVPTLTGAGAGQVRVSWPSNWDRDDLSLTYKVIRDNNGGSPIFTTTGNATFWSRPVLSYVDAGVAPGSTHNYRIQAVDRDGNTVIGNNVSIKAPAGIKAVQQAKADGADPFWRPSAVSAPAAAVPPTAAPTSPTRSPVVTPPAFGPITQAVATGAVTTKKAVPLTATQTFRAGVDVRVTKIASVDVRAQGPGEIAGAGVSITVTVRNRTKSPIDLRNTLVALTDSHGDPAISIDSGSTPIMGSIAPGKTALGSYQFKIPENRRDSIRIAVSTTTEAPVVVFGGRVG